MLDCVTHRYGALPFHDTHQAATADCRADEAGGDAWRSMDAREFFSGVSAWRVLLCVGR